jgi:glutamine synthetase type III
MNTMFLNTLSQLARSTHRQSTVGGARSMSSMLSNLNGNRFDDHALKASVAPAVYDSFHAAVEAGEPCDKATSKALSEALMKWASERGATMKAHWFR